MSKYGKAPPSLSRYECDQCGEVFYSLASLVRCSKCTSSNVTEVNHV